MKNDFTETLDAIKDAYQEGYKNATEKAFEFITENIDKYVYHGINLQTGYDEIMLILNFDEDFKKYMEGE